MKTSAKRWRRLVLVAVGCLVATSLAAVPDAAASDIDRQGMPAPTSTDTFAPLAVGDLMDGGFEAGTPNPYWNEASDAFGSPLCTVADCGTGAGTGPHGGDWWVWFGGTQDTESAYVGQEVLVPSGTEVLTFYLEIPVADTISRFEVWVDGESVFVATDSDQSTYATYTEVDVDISAYADDDTHLLTFAFAKVEGGSANFFLDDVSLGTTSTGTVQGIVRHNGSPLPGVEVWLGYGARNTCTAADGTFVFTNVPAGEKLVAITGPAEVLPCSNAAFENSLGQLLGIQAWDHKGINYADEFTVAAGEVKFIDFDVVLRQAPIAVADKASVKNGGTVKIDVLSNDSNPEGEALEIIKASDPAHGTATWNPSDGKFTYTHDGSATTADSFTYKLADSKMESAPAVVSISIAPSAAPTVGLQDPATGRWHLQGSDGNVVSFYFGNPGDYPFMGDWNGDGIDTPGLYRQSDGYVYLRNSNTQGIADIKFFFGNPGDVPLAGDFNGNGFDTVSIYRPSNQTFYIINKLGSGDQGLGAADFSYVFGNPGDKPFVGDFDGDGIETAGLHRESTGLVYFRNSHTQGIADAQFIYGDPGDRLVAGDWNANGTDSPALFRPSNTTFYFRYTNTQGIADAQATWGEAGWLPVAGSFGTLKLPSGIETVEQFLKTWDAALQAGDGPWLYSRIHPMALNALGTGQCQAYWNQPLPKDLTAKNVLLSKSIPTLWRFEYPGVVLNVPNTYSVRTKHTSEGITETSTWHLGIVGKELNWFPSGCSD
jgi:hypothetical protein